MHLILSFLKLIEREQCETSYIDVQWCVKNNIYIPISSVHNTGIPIQMINEKLLYLNPLKTYIHAHTIYENMSHYSGCLLCIFMQMERHSDCCCNISARDYGINKWYPKLGIASHLIRMVRLCFFIYKIQRYQSQQTHKPKETWQIMNIKHNSVKNPSNDIR